jgi:cell division protein FtsB
MENRFYRKNGENILSKLLNKPGMINKKIIFLLVILTIFLFLLLNNKGIVQRIKLEYEKKKINEQIQNEEQRQKKYQEEIYLLKNSNEKIEKVAREKYNMKRPGETVYKKKNNKPKE